MYTAACCCKYLPLAWTYQQLCKLQILFTILVHLKVSKLCLTNSLVFCVLTEKRRIYLDGLSFSVRFLCFWLSRAVSHIFSILSKRFYQKIIGSVELGWMTFVLTSITISYAVINLYKSNCHTIKLLRCHLGKTNQT